MRNDRIAVAIVITTLTSSVLSAQQWTQVQPPRNSNFSSISEGKNTLIEFDSKLYVTTDSGISVSSDDGVTWKALSPFKNRGLISILRTKNAILAADDVSVYRSSDEGFSWIKTEGLGDFIYAAGFLSQFGSLLYVHPGFGRSSDDGQTWESWRPGHEFFVVIEDGMDLIASHNGGGMYRSKDSGRTWTLTYLNMQAQALLKKGDRLISGTQDRAYLSTDSGYHWTPSRKGMPPYLTIHDLTLYQNTIFAGTQLGVYFSTDDAASWRPLNVGFPDERAVYEVLVAGDYLYAIARVPEISLYRMPLSQLGSASVKVHQEQTSYVSPNPATNFVTVSCAGRVTITNMLGLDVLDIVRHDRSNITLDVSKLPAGTYFVRSDGSTMLQKLVKE